MLIWQRIHDSEMEYGMRNVECGMRNAECGMRNAECGMRNHSITKKHKSPTDTLALWYFSTLAL